MRVRVTFSSRGGALTESGGRAAEPPSCEVWSGKQFSNMRLTDVENVREFSTAIDCVVLPTFGTGH